MLTCGCGSLRCTAPTARAAEGNGGTYSITIDNAQSGQTYTLYKLFNATVNDARASATDNNNSSEVETKGISYTVPSGKSLAETSWTKDSEAITTKAGTTWFSADNAGNVTAVENADLTTADFRNWATCFGTQVGDAKTKTQDSTSVVFSNLTSGYYFITSTTGSLVTVTSIAPNAIVKDKNTVPDVDKTEDVKTSDVGDEVTYTVHVHLTKGATNVVFHDRLGDGLTLQGNGPVSVTVPGTETGSTMNLIKDTDYTVDYWNSTKADTNATSEKTRGDNITISFTSNYLEKLSKDTTVTITYRAKNTAGTINMSNDAFVTYGDSNTESTHDKVYESSFVFKVAKVDGDNNNSPLNGAKFVLSKKSGLGNLTEANVNENKDNLLKFDNNGLLQPNGSNYLFDANNTVTFGGLNDNTSNNSVISYYLYEVTAPAGYSKLTGPVEIQIEPSFDTAEPTKVSEVTGYKVKYKLPGQSTFTYVGGNDNPTTGLNADHIITITNVQGSHLPNTGGPGTAWMCAIGGALVAAAAIGLIARRRMRQNH